ncbi:MAG: sulfoxide reductase heme-binding subunit YedZ [Anaerolineales bacterium]|nr:sulfoxide reductase heme-binding subunit YedZ [Anaerolineales bacterium]
MDTLKRNWLRILTHVGAVIPLIWLLWDYWFDNLTVNPIQDITFRTGKPALILLVLSLACTPVNTLFGFKQVLPLRKPLGLYAFLYVCLHFLTFIGLDYGFNWGLLYEAIFEKRYALVGFAAFLILLPLAVTSTQGWMRRLGKNWKRLHRWVYLAGILAVVHYVWLVKADIREPLLYGAAIGLLLILRLPAIRKAVTHFRSRFKKERRTRTVVV